GVYRRGDVWWVRFRRDGVHVRRSARTSKRAEAQVFLHRLMEEHTQATRGEPVVRHLITDAMERFFEETTLKAGTVETYRYNSRVLTRLLGHLHLDEIDRRALADFVATRKRTGVTDATIRRDLALIGSIFTAAIRWGWADTSPVTRFNKKTLRESSPRTRFLAREEFARLHNAASADLKPILVLAVETGLRKEELLSLTLPSIDLRRRELRLTLTKTGRPRQVPLSTRALETIKELLERSRPRSPYLFCKSDGARVGDPKKAFGGACHRAGIEDFRFHDLRHTYASWWVQDGGDLYRLSRILGHTTLQMSSRYAHLRTDDLHEELERVTRRRSRKRSQERQIEADGSSMPMGEDHP
ncbi:tyrosine-type recombinase/integrase, partial [Methylobacterium sp. J-077]|uniref:tyrosine-type recombinase/integrase n=1 Tax=Methylobacterium sp. J-077 TaxID=2836656 RepID=UPI001FB9D02D